jgi:tetratricopeptide (TPR) repeat protein
MPPWLAGELVEALGPGTARAALASARKQDRRTLAAGYYDAFEGEAAYHAGDEEEAEQLLARALGRLPDAEQLLRARTLVLLASLRMDRGAHATALRDYERTLQMDPSALRRTGLSLPVRIQASGELGEDVADAVGRSPRFDVGSQGLMLQIRADRAQGQACLIGVSGAELSCGRAQAKANESGDVLIEKLLADLHERAFAPRVDLTQIDANSLDGSNLRGTSQDLSPLLEGEGME